MIAEFEAFEIYLVARRLAKIDASESHWHAFIGPPPIVPRVFALQSKGDKKFLIVFFFGHQISGKSLLLKIAASFMPCAAKFCAAPSSRSTTARARRTWAVWP